MPDKRKGYSVYKHGRQWYVGFQIDGRRYQKPCGFLERDSREEAEKAARAFVENTHSQLKRARNHRQSQNPIALYQRRLSGRSLSHQENCARILTRFLQFFGDVDMAALTRGDVEAWRDWLASTAPRNDRKKGRLSPKSVKEHLDWLAAVFNESDLTNPCRNVERPRPTHAEQTDALKFFTPDEMTRLFEVCASNNPRFYNGFVFTAFTGCRVAEVQGLRPENIDAKNRIVWVVGKGEKRRPLRLTGPVAPAWDALQDEIKKHPKPHGFVFSQSPTWARKGMDRLCKAAFGVDDDGYYIRPGHPHMLRHTLASMALMVFTPAWDIVFLAKWLGHRDINTTYKIYGHWLAPEAPSGYASPGILNAATGGV